VPLGKSRHTAAVPELAIGEARFDDELVRGLLARWDAGPGGNPAALALVRGAGYGPIPDYNGNPHSRHRLAKQLAG
jgi:hypothetical protein